MTDVSVNELLALIGEQAVRMRYLETQLSAALEQLVAQESNLGSAPTDANELTKQEHTE